MAIPKKGSRTVTVKEVRYRWRIRSKPTHNQWDYAGHFTVAVERAEQPSPCVLLSHTRFPRADILRDCTMKSVTPSGCSVH
jgi:hypothetical protein